MSNSKSLLVLITTYNHGAYIKDCINSVLDQQTKYDVKIVCFDDCSTDETTEILKGIQKQFPDKIQILQNKKNLGRGRFSIIKKANEFSQNYDYWALLNGDDKWLNNYRVERQIDILEKNLNYIGCCGQTKMYDKTGKFLKIIKQDVPFYNLKDLIMLEGYKNLYAHPSSFIWKNIYYKKFKFILPKNKFFKIWGDLSIIYLMLNLDDKKKIFCLDEIVSKYNFNEKGIWSSLSKEKKEKINKNYYLNLISMVSIKYKILIILKKLNILNGKKN